MTLMYAAPRTTWDYSYSIMMQSPKQRVHYRSVIRNLVNAAIR